MAVVLSDATSDLLRWYCALTHHRPEYAVEGIVHENLRGARASYEEGENGDDYFNMVLADVLRATHHGEGRFPSMVGKRVEQRAAPVATDKEFTSAIAKLLSPPGEQSKQPQPHPTGSPSSQQQEPHEKPLRVELVLKGRMRHLFLAMADWDQKTPAEWLADSVLTGLESWLEYSQHSNMLEGCGTVDLTGTSCTIAI